MIPGIQNIADAGIQEGIFRVLPRDIIIEKINGLLQHRLFQLVHGLKMFVYRPGGGNQLPGNFAGAQLLKSLFFDDSQRGIDNIGPAINNFWRHAIPGLFKLHV